VKVRVFTDLTVMPDPSESIEDTFDDISERVRASLEDVGIVHHTTVEVIDPMMPHQTVESTDDILATAFEMGTTRGRY
jgi:hypothetical protein